MIKQFSVKVTIPLVVALFLFLFPIPSSLFPTFAQQATIALSPATGTYNRGCAFSLEVNLNTGGAQTDGTDAILLYDSSKLSATSITNGTIYSEYPGNNIDGTNGKITISGLASVSTPFSGAGKLATVNFTVKDAATSGATQISFDFDAANKTKTTDSNVVQRGTVVDILNSVTNGSYTIGTASCANPSSAPVPPPGGVGGVVSTPSGQVKTPYVPPYNNIDQVVGAKTGNSELTVTVAIVGSVMVVLGVLGLVLL